MRRLTPALKRYEGSTANTCGVILGKEPDHSHLHQPVRIGRSTLVHIVAREGIFGWRPYQPGYSPPTSFWNKKMNKKKLKVGSTVDAETAGAAALAPALGPPRALDEGEALWEEFVGLSRERGGLNLNATENQRRHTGRHRETAAVPWTKLVILPRE
jgi:hypothetical protein